MRLRILGVKIDPINPTQIESLIEQFLHGNKKHQIVTINPEFIVQAQRDEEFKKILNAADLALADGSGIVLAAIFLQAKKIKRVTGTDLLLRLAKHSAQKKSKIFLLGGDPSWVAKKTAETLKEKFSNLLIESHPGCKEISKESEKEKTEVIKAINKFAPDILFVAYGAPHQEKWIYNNFPQLEVKVAIGVGGAFNYIIGISSRAPRVLRKLGVEWLWRLVTEPQRWRRIINAVVVFPLLVLKEKSTCGNPKGWSNS